MNPPNNDSATRLRGQTERAEQVSRQIDSRQSDAHSDITANAADGELCDRRVRGQIDGQFYSAKMNPPNNDSATRLRGQTERAEQVSRQIDSRQSDARSDITANVADGELCDRRMRGQIDGQNRQRENERAQQRLSDAAS